MEKPLLYRVSFKIMNLAALFLTFLASSTSCGSRPSWRKDRIGVIQLLPLCIVKVWTSSMLGHLWTSIYSSVLIGPTSDDDCFASLSAPIFWLLRICVNST